MPPKGRHKLWKHGEAREEKHFHGDAKCQCNVDGRACTLRIAANGDATTSATVPNIEAVHDLMQALPRAHQTLRYKSKSVICAVGEPLGFLAIAIDSLICSEEVDNSVQQAVSNTGSEGASHVGACHLPAVQKDKGMRRLFRS